VNLEPGAPLDAIEPLHPPAALLTGSTVAAMTAGGLAVNILLKARGLIVVPLYARLLDPHGLGVVALATAVATLVAPALHLGLPVGMLVELPHRRGAPFTRGWRAALLVIGLACGLALLALPWLLTNGPWPSLQPLVPQAIVIGTLAVGMAWREAGLVVPQLGRQVRFLSLVALAVDYGGATIGLLLVVLGWGAGGLLWGLAATTIAGAAVTILRSRRLCPPSDGADFAFVRAALAVGLPMAAITTAQWVVQSADRFFLAHYSGAATVGVYGLGYSVASSVLALAAALNLVFLPVAVPLLRTAPDRLVRFLEESVRLTIVVLGLCVAGAFVVGMPVMRRLGGAAYAAAGQVLPWMVMSYALFTLVQLLQWVPMTVSRRVHGAFAVYGTMAALNVVLDAILIPRLGMHGAVIAAVSAYAVGVMLMAALARREIPRWQFTSAGAALSLAGLGALGASLVRLPPTASVLAIAAAGLATIGVYTGAGLVLRAVHRLDFSLLGSALRTGASRLRG
jgi:O-antigen/teichoic acid export membrane protein